jgi:hypothetical protein
MRKVVHLRTPLLTKEGKTGWFSSSAQFVNADILNTSHVEENHPVSRAKDARLPPLLRKEGSLLSNPENRLIFRKYCFKIRPVYDTVSHCRNNMAASDL